VRFDRAFLQTFTVQVIQSAASVATGVLIARGLGPSDQGRYALLVASVGVGALVAALGQFQGNVLSAAERSTSGRTLLLRSALQCLGVVLVLLVIDKAGLLRPAVRGVGDLAYVFIAVLCVEALAQMVRGINLGQHDVTAFNVGTFLQRAVYLGLVIVLWRTARVALLPVAIAWLAAVLASVLVAGLLAWRRSEAGSVTWHALRYGWGTGIIRGLRALTSVGLGIVLVRCDVYMLGPMLGMATVGQVSVATSTAEWLWYVPSILNNLLFAASAADPSTRGVNQIARVTRSLVALLIVASTVLMFVGKSLVHLLYGAAYAEAGTLFILLLPGAAALALHMVVDAYFAAKGFPPITIWGPALALAGKVSLNLVLVPRFGAIGAVCATSLVYIFLLMIKVGALSHEATIPLRELLRPTWRDLAVGLGSLKEWLLRRA